MNKETILIVEDDGIIATRIKKMLTELGYIVADPIDSGEEAFLKAGEIRPSLVLMDIQLIGEMDGIEAAENIRTRFDIPVIYLTAYSDDIRLQQAKVTEPYGYLIKPIQGRELHAAIEIAIYKHRMERKIKAIEKERRRMEARVYYSEKMESLGRIAGAIAHHYNNIMFAILGNAELIQMRLSPASGIQSNISSIITSVKRATKISTQILEYTGQIQIESEHIHLSELVRKILPLIEAGLSPKIAAEYHLNDDIPLIDVDPNHIRQLLINLVINAQEAVGDQQGVIRISTGIVNADKNFLSEFHSDPDLPEGIYVFLDIADNGCGMDDVTQSEIFEPFFTTKLFGRGLGLSSVLGIVKQHQGAIRVSSKSGVGTTFRVLFPQSAAHKY